MDHAGVVVVNDFTIGLAELLAQVLKPASDLSSLIDVLLQLILSQGVIAEPGVKRWILDRVRIVDDHVVGEKIIIHELEVRSRLEYVVLQAASFWAEGIIALDSEDA